MVIPATDPLAVALATAIEQGTVDVLLDERPEVVSARVADGRGCERDALHLLLDWPGNRPRTPETIRALVDGGADVNSRLVGPNEETPLHWAASFVGGVPAIDALLDAGADVDAPGSVIDGGPPLSNALAFRLWPSAHRLVERGSSVGLWQAATLGHLQRVRRLSASAGERDLHNALWCAGHGGQVEVAAHLLERGADPAWVGHDRLSAAGAARRSGFTELAGWLEDRAG